VNPGDFQVGKEVEVMGYYEEGILIALRIKCLEEEQPELEEVDLEGEITSINLEEGSLVLDGETEVFTDGETEVVDDHHQPIDFSDLGVDDRIWVKGYVLDNGDDKTHHPRPSALLAVKIKRKHDADAPEVFEFNGRITAIDKEERIFMIGERRVITDGDTEFKDHESRPIDFEDFRVGERVRVAGYANKSISTVVAVLVKKRDAPKEYTLRGRIENLNPASGVLLVDGKIIHTNTDTELLSRGGDPLSLEDFRVGEKVEVKAIEFFGDKTVQSYLALRIKKEQGELENTEFDGIITGIDRGDRRLHIAGKHVLVTEDTLIVDASTEDPLGFEDLEVGDEVAVEGYILKTVGSVVATKIVRLNSEVDPGEPVVEGLLRGVVPSEGLLIVGHTLVETNNSTRICDHEGNPLRLRDLREGDMLKVYGERKPDDSVLAEKVVRGRRHDNCRQRVKGFISELNLEDGTFVVAMLKLRVDEGTQILGLDRTLIGFEELAVGHYIEATYCRDSGIPPVADTIRVRNPEGESVVQGFVLEVDLDAMALVVSGDYTNTTGVYVRTTPATELRDEQNHPIKLAEFAPLDLVQAKGSLREDGSLDASKVRRLPVHEDCRGKVRGFLTDYDLTTGVLVVGLVEIQTTENTKFVDRNGNQTDLLALEIGDMLEVHFCSGVGRPVANLVKVRDREDFDFEEDGVVDGTDMLEVIHSHCMGGHLLDLNGDGVTTPDDVFQMSTGWGRRGQH
jgi:hypothetical protein